MRLSLWSGGGHPLGAEALLPVAEGGLHRPVVLGDEVLDLASSVGEELEHGALHPSHRDEVPRLQGEETGVVHAHEPVRLGPGVGGQAEVAFLLAVHEMGEGLLETLVGHVVRPEPEDGLLAGRLHVDAPEDELALPSGVGGVDDRVHVVPRQEALHDFELLLRARQHVEAEAPGDHGQLLETPASGPAGVLLLGLGDVHEMAHGPGDDPFLALEKAVPSAVAHGENPRDLAGHGGFLGDDETLSHGSGPS